MATGGTTLTGYAGGFCYKRVTLTTMYSNGRSVYSYYDVSVEFIFLNNYCTGKNDAKDKYLPLMFIKENYGGISSGLNKS